MKGSWLLTQILCSVLILTIGWAAYEKHVQNTNLYLTPEEKVHAKERQFHQDLGSLRGRLDEHLRQMDELDKKLTDELTNLTAITSATSGRVDVMQKYFEKYSPDSFEEKVGKLHKEFSSFKDDLENYVTQESMTGFSHLPSKWEWDSQQTLVKNKIKELDELLLRVNKLEAESISNPPQKEIFQNEPEVEDDLQEE